MSLRKLWPTAVAFLILLTSTVAFAGDRAGTFSLSPMFGVCLFEGDQQLKTSAAYGGTLGYNVDEHKSFEFGFNFIDSGTRHGNSVDVRTYFYHLDGVYHLTRRGIVQPYVAMGIGGMTFDYEGPGNRSNTAFAFNHGGGVEVFLMDNLAIRGDVRHIITSNGGFNDLLATAGVTVFFSGKKPKAVAEAAPPPPPPAPAPEPAPAPKVEAPAPPPAPEPVVTPEPVKPAPLKKELVIDVKVEFDFDKSFVRPIYHDELARVSKYLKDYPDNYAVLEGHTDSRGSVKYNQILSQKRAESVRQYMIDNFGVDGSKLSAKGYGKLRPIATNDTEEGRQRNRRTELHIKPLSEMQK